MDAVSFISQSLAQVNLRLLATCEGLTNEQMLWRANPHANNIGFILWHMARAEDYSISRLSQGMQSGQSTLWASEGWYQKFGQPIDAPDPGDKMGLQSLPIPALDVLIGYARATHQQTRGFLIGLTPEALDTSPAPDQPDRTMAVSLRHLITHKNNHHGQIDYIRGLQDENWDLPPGTGSVLPPSAS